MGGGYEFEGVGANGGDICEQAMQRIHRYNRKLERFEKKMGILIH